MQFRVGMTIGNSSLVYAIVFGLSEEAEFLDIGALFGGDTRGGAARGECKGLALRDEQAINLGLLPCPWALAGLVERAIRACSPV